MKKSKKILAMVAAVLAVVLVGLLGVFFWHSSSNPVALKDRVYVVQVNENFNPLDNLRYVFMGDDNDVQVEGLENTNTNVIGDYELSYVYDGKSYPFTVSVVDQKAPEFTVSDVTTDTVQDLTGEEFISSVSDDSDWTVSLDYSEDPKTEGSQTVTVTVTDAHGNSSSQEATLTREKDTEAPHLANSDEVIEIKSGDELNASVLQVADNLDSSPSIEILSDFDTFTPGYQEVTFSVTDRSGNSEVFTQGVDVKENLVVYLTFDDGPSQNTKEILDILDRYGVKATFFVTGQTPEYYGYMKEAAEAGHTIAIHTLTHDFGYVYSSVDSYFEDLEAMKAVIKEWTGIDADCIRFPGGSSNTISAGISPGIMSTLVDAVHERGYEYFDWNVDSTDASGNNIPASSIINGATSQIGTSNAVILFHDTDAKDTTVEALPAIIEAYQAAGYEFAPISKDTYPAHHGVNN